MTKNVTAVERRNWNEIEYGKHKVDDCEFVKKQCNGHQDGTGLGGKQIEMIGINERQNVDDRSSKMRNQSDCTQSNRSGSNHNEITYWPYYRGEDVVEHRIAEVARVDRSWFSPADHREVREHGDKGQQNRTEWIDMFDRVQRDPSEHAGGRVAAEVGHPSMGRFVNADGEHKSDDLKQDVNVLEGHSSS